MIYQKGLVMLILLFLLTIPIYAADSEPSTPLPSESPAHMIEEAALEGLPEALHIIAECLGDQKEAAATEVVGCILNPQSPARKIARGSVLCCLGCVKKKR